MMKHPLPGLLLAAGLALTGPRLVLAQAKNQVYTFVEQMPQLPGETGIGAVQRAILKNFRYPAGTEGTAAGRRLFVQFTVSATGKVEDAQVIRGLSPGLDAAALAAVRQLPRFVPGRQNGRNVAVSFTVPLQVGADAAPSPAPSGEREGVSVVVDEKMVEYMGSGTTTVNTGEVVTDSLHKVYTYVEQMPALPGNGGTAAVVTAIQQQLVLPPDAQEGRLFIQFTVGPYGSVYDAKVVKGLGASTDAAALAAVRRLPRFVPGKQNGRAVAVSFTLPVTVFLPDHVFAVSEVATRARFATPGLSSYLQHNLRVPAVVASEKLRGWVGVDMVVLASGKAEKPVLTSHVCASCDAEALRLVAAFPAWLPARDAAGHAVAVRQHIDIPFPLPGPSAPSAKPDKPFTYVSVPPTLLDGTPAKDLGSLLAQMLQYPEIARREKITGTAQLEFIVDADGQVRSPRFTQSVCTSCDQAILAALTALGLWMPGRQQPDGQPLAVQLQVAVPFSAAPLAAPKK